MKNLNFYETTKDVTAAYTACDNGSFKTCKVYES